MIEELPDPRCLSLHDYQPFEARFGKIRALLDGAISCETAESVSNMLSEYQEIPELIDPYLQSLVDMIVTVLRSDQLDIGSAMLYTLCKVRSVTTVTKFLPHTPTHFKFVLTLLQTDDNFSWQTRFSLLTWLSILVMLPFSLETIVDSSSGDVVGDLLNLFSSYLLHSAPTSTAAARAISRLLSRNDSNTASFSHFIQWSQNVLAASLSDVDSAEKMNRTIGNLNSLVQLLKTVPRAKMLTYLDQIMDLFPMELTESKSVRLRLLSLKLLQRIGMMYLPSEAALWRYKMGRRSLLHNLKPGTSSSEERGVVQDKIAPDAMLDQQRSLENVPLERLETILDKLLLGLCDSDTVVRWSAAKGIGRCTMRLDRSMADDVLSNIVSMFETSSVSTHNYWHGGLLALAEFCRRGILLPHRLEAVVPIVCQGTVFEETLGTHSVGSNVRDAACYVAWSFARAYSPKEMAPFAKDLSSVLIITALFDREVNVRRAACAAFQENVGRHGLFPSGIACNTIADYFTIGNVVHSYKIVALEMGEQQHYTDAMISHLLSLKICHWDCNLRVLACESLAILCGLLSDFGCSRVIPDLITRSMSDSVPERHGAVTALAAVLKSFSTSCKTVSEITPELQSNIRNLIPNIEKARLYRGRGGELVRSAVCKLMQAISILRFSLQLKTIKRYQQTINENLVQPNDNVRNAAIECLADFSEAYYDSLTDEEVSTVIQHFVSELGASYNVASTRGCALALGSLPIRFLQHDLSTVCSQLMAASQPIQVPDRLDAETRQLSLQSLVSICCRLPGRVQCDLVNMPEDLASKIRLKVLEIDGEPNDLLIQCVSCLLFGLEDYATDNRGDIGSWVRMTAVEGLEKALTFMISRDVTTRAINTSIISAILKQSMEKLDKVRRLSGETLSRLICFELDIPLKSELRSILCPGKDWSSAAVTFPSITPLLKHADFRTDLYSGLVISAGGLTATIARYALQSLASLLSPVDDGSKAIACSLLELTVQLLINESCNVRVVLPVFNTLSQMLLYPAVKSAADDTIIDRIREQTMKQCRDFRLVSIRLASIDVLCALLHYNHLGNEIANRNFSALVATLQHKIPKVRKICAEKFYSNLLVLDCDSGLNTEDLDAALSILVSNSWINNTDVTALCEALHVVSTKRKTTKIQLQRNDAKEFRYQDFIHDLNR